MDIKDGVKQESEISAFLMIGQSNMAGRGEFSEVEPISNKLCYMLRMGRWQKMSEPINPDRPIFEGKFHSGVSLGASFADDLARKGGERIGLIPCADGEESGQQVFCSCCPLCGGGVLCVIIALSTCRF